MNKPNRRKKVLWVRKVKKKKERKRKKGLGWMRPRCPKRLKEKGP